MSRAGARRLRRLLSCWAARYLGCPATTRAPACRARSMPSVTFAKHVEIADGTLKVQRQTDAGYDECESPLPAVVSVTDWTLPEASSITFSSTRVLGVPAAG